MSKKIINLIRKKNTNVILSADLTSKDAILNLVSKIHHKILGVKLHSDIIIGWNIEFINKLKEIAENNILIIEDRKFCDIGNTVKLQSKLITEYADLITVHSVPGPGILDGLRENCLKNNCKILLIAQMSSKDNLIDDTYTTNTIKMAVRNNDIVIGFIGQEKLDSELITFTPGVHFNMSADTCGQNYNSPEYLIDKKGSSVLIVGRGIYQSKDPLSSVEKYIHLEQ